MDAESIIGSVETRGAKSHVAHRLRDLARALEDDDDAALDVSVTVDHTTEGFGDSYRFGPEVLTEEIESSFRTDKGTFEVEMKVVKRD